MIPVQGAEIQAFTYWPETVSDNETFPLLVNYHGDTLSGFKFNELIISQEADMSSRVHQSIIKSVAIS